MNPSPEFEALLDYLKLTRGCDLTVYKRSNLMRRFQQRMQIVGISSYDNYLEYLKVYPEEYVPLFNTILINVTAFFRDRDSWNFLLKNIIPQIIARKKPNEPIRVWSAACASGEEAYTLSILLAEALGIEQFLERVKIYATDVDKEALNQARQAEYNAQDVMNIPGEFLEKYFEQKTEQRYVFHQKLRRPVIFGCHNLIQDAPISRLDLLVCRNALIYFTTEAQEKISARFHFALNDNGFLFLGKAETWYNKGHLFRLVSSKQHVFTKVSKRSRQEQLLLTNQTRPQLAVERLPPHLSISQAAFEKSSVAQIVVKLNGFLTMANEQARLLFGLNPGDLERPWQNLELYNQIVELRPCVERVYRERRTNTIRDVEWSTPSCISYLDVQVELMPDSNGSWLGVCLTFTDVTDRKQLQKKLEQSNK